MPLSLCGCLVLSVLQDDVFLHDDGDGDDGDGGNTAFLNCFASASKNYITHLVMHAHCLTSSLAPFLRIQCHTG